MPGPCLPSTGMATARPRSASEPRPDRLTRLLASATERDGSSPDGEGDVWAELLADDERARGEDDARPGGRGRHRSTGPARVVTTPAALRGAQLSVRGTAVVGVLLALVVVVGVVGLRWWLAEQGATPQPLPPHGPGAPVAAAPGAAGATAPGAGDALSLIHI